MFSVQPDVLPDGTLTFTSADATNGTATVTVAIRDDGGTDNGGVDASLAETFHITVSSPAPTAAAIASFGTPDNATLPSANVGQLINIGGADLESNSIIVFPTVDDAGATGTRQVLVSGVNAQGTSATVVVPLKAATGNLTVLGKSGSFPLQIVPTITGFTASVFSTGSNLRLDGNGFVEGAITVNFGSSVSVVDQDTGTSILDVLTDGLALNVTIPAGAGQDLSLVTSGGTSNVVNAVSPSVSVTSPDNGDQLPAGATIDISASAIDGTGIQTVEFLVDSSVVGTDNSAPYQFAIVVPAFDSGGNNTVTIAARATDIDSNVTTSEDVVVTVTVPVISVNSTAAVGTALNSSVASANVGQTITMSSNFEAFDSLTDVVFPARDDSGNAFTISVRVSGVNAEGTSASVFVPLRAETGNLTVPGTSGSFPLQIVPTITGFANFDFQPSGTGLNLTLEGDGFIEGGITVNFGSSVSVVDPDKTTATLDVFNIARSIGVVIPVSGEATISVVTAGGTSNSLVVGPISFTGISGTAQVGTPTSGAAPSANVGQIITISGTDLKPNTDVVFPARDDSGNAFTISIRVSGVNAEGTSASVLVPLRAETGNLGVPGTSGSFPLQIVPTITSLSTTALIAGSTLLVEGDGFIEGEITVNFGGVAVVDADKTATTLDVFNVTRSINVVVPVGAQSSVTVVTAGGTSNSAE